MSYIISETEAPSVWQVVFTGIVDAKERQTAVEEGLKVTAGVALTGILVDLRAAETLMSVTEQYLLGTRVASIPQFRGVRIVFLLSPGKEAGSQFLETVEANRGVLTAIHTDRDEALHWLSEANSNR